MEAPSNFLELPRSIDTMQYIPEPGQDAGDDSFAGETYGSVLPEDPPKPPSAGCELSLGFYSRGPIAVAGKQDEARRESPDMEVPTNFFELPRSIDTMEYIQEPGQDAGDDSFAGETYGSVLSEDPPISPGELTRSCACDKIEDERSLSYINASSMSAPPPSCLFLFNNDIDFDFDTKEQKWDETFSLPTYTLVDGDSSKTDLRDDIKPGFVAQVAAKKRKRNKKKLTHNCFKQGGKEESGTRFKKRKRDTKKLTHNCPKQGGKEESGTRFDCILCSPHNFCFDHTTREDKHPRKRDCVCAPKKNLRKNLCVHHKPSCLDKEACLGCERKDCCRICHICKPNCRLCTRY